MVSRGRSAAVKWIKRSSSGGSEAQIPGLPIILVVDGYSLSHGSLPNVTE